MSLPTAVERDDPHALGADEWSSHGTARRPRPDLVAVAGVGRGKGRKPAFRCGECSTPHAKWVGQCDGCGRWNTVEEDHSSVPSALVSALVPAVRRVIDIDCSVQPVLPTGIAELDRVMGGGLTRGSTVLVGGEPGIGKSTLLVQALGSLAVGGVATLYVTAEESEVQVARRATRLGLADSGLALASTTSVEAICGAIAAVRPDVVVVDSIQTVHVEGAAGAAGSASQVRAATQQLIAHAKAAGATLVLVGHVTKDGSLAGPRQLEHIVDTVLTFDGDRYQNLRYLRAVKHRFGPTNEVGLLSMGEMGLDTVEDPSGTFLTDRSRGLSGSAITCTLDGRRPLLAEIQALLVERAGASSRRAVQGLDSGRVELLLAVLHRRCGVPTANLDAFALAMAGARVLEPASDLAISMAVVSAITGRPLPHDAVLCGEVGLSGELRQVGDVPRRLSEAARLGFRRAVVPTGCGTSVPTMDVVEVNSLTEAILTLIPPEATGSASRSARGDC